MKPSRCFVPGAPPSAVQPSQYAAGHCSLLRFGYGMTTFALPCLNCEIGTDSEPPLAARTPSEAPFENNVKLTGQLLTNCTCPAVIGVPTSGSTPLRVSLLSPPPQPAPMPSS